MLQLPRQSPQLHRTHPRPWDQAKHVFKASQLKELTRAAEKIDEEIVKKSSTIKLVSGQAASRHERLVAVDLGYPIRRRAAEHLVHSGSTVGTQ